MISYTTKLIFDSEFDKESVLELLLWQKDVFNECSKVVFELKKKSIIDLHAKFYTNFRKSQAKIPSQIIICSQRECLARYKSIRSNKHIISKPIEKKNLSIQLDKRIYSIKGDQFSLISSKGRVKCKPFFYKKLKENWDKYRICDPLLFVKNNEIWISLMFEITEVKIEENSVVGLDLGVRLFAVSSEGNVYDNKKFKKEKRQLRFLKRKLQSKGTKSAKRHLKKLRRKERNKSKNFIHNITKDILTDIKSNVIALENLKGIKNKKHKYENKNVISQVSLAEFRRVLTYKAPFYGKMVILVDKKKKKKTDCRTGKIDGIRKGRRYYGSDGVVLDADYNAAINIAFRAHRPTSFKAPLDGTLNFCWQAVVNQPIVCKTI